MSDAATAGAAGDDDSYLGLGAPGTGSSSVDDEAEFEGSSWKPEDDDDDELEAGAGKGDGDGDDELEDYEDGEKRYRIPKALVPRLMKDADYTTKTQELAKNREEFEGQRKQIAETTRGHMSMLQDVAKVVTLNDQLAAYEKVTPEQWAAAHDRDPDACSKARLEMQLLREARDRAAGDLRQKEQRRLETQRGEAAKQIEQRDAVLARDVPGWTKESTSKLARDPAVKAMGFSAEEVEGITDPRAIKVLRAAVIGAKAQAKASAQEKAEKLQQAEPAKPVRGAGPPKSGLSDKLSSDEWYRRREAQRASKRR